MTSDSTPVFALEKEALKTEIETGLQVGVDHLEEADETQACGKVSQHQALAQAIPQGGLCDPDLGV